MKLYKESNVVYQHKEIYEAMRDLSEYRKKSFEGENIPIMPMVWTTSYSLGRQAGHSSFIKSVLDSTISSYAIVGERGRRYNEYPRDKTTTLSEHILFQPDGIKYNILVDAGSAFQNHNMRDLYAYLEENREYISSCVVIGT